MIVKGKKTKPIWFDWATFDSEGSVNGVTKEAPEAVKKAYDDYLRNKEEDLKKGIK